jgi:hypothetical protein
LALHAIKSFQEENPMTTEYRSSSGNRLRIEANGRVTADRSTVNLRALGCPEELVDSLERKREARQQNLANHDVKARAAKIGAQIAADNAKFAHVLAAPAEETKPAVSSFVDSGMANRLKQASGRLSR